MKTVIVTGGSKGIGAAISEEFSQNGWAVFIGARHEIDVTSENIYFVKMDVREEDGHQTIAKAAIAKTGSIDAIFTRSEAGTG